jgi:hypothetical protein
MNKGTWHRLAAWLLVWLAFACGLIGLIAGLTNHLWKLGPLGWFGGGALLALLAVFLVVDKACALPRPDK